MSLLWQLGNGMQAVTSRQLSMHRKAHMKHAQHAAMEIGLHLCCLKRWPTLAVRCPCKLLHRKLFMKICLAMQ